MSKGLVLGFVGQQSQDVLAWSSIQTCMPFKELGYNTEIINLYQEDTLSRVAHIVQNNKVLFAFGFAGVGSQLKAGGTWLWDYLRIPFLSFLGDHPAYHPKHHCLNSRYICNVYRIKDFYETQKKYLRSEQPTFLLQPRFNYQQLQSKIEWRDRPIQFLFLKNGSDPSELELIIKNWPKESQEVFWDCVKCCELQTNILIADVVAKRANLRPEWIQVSDDSFWGMVQVVDDYIRRKRMTWMVNLLKQVPAHIIGDGWGYINKDNSKATFLPSVKAESLLSLYIQSKYTVNTNPYFEHSTHERVFHGLNANSYVVSDNNAFAQENLCSIKSYFGFDWSDNNKEERVLEYLNSPRAFPPPRDDVERLTATFCDVNSHINSLINIISLVKQNQI